MLYSSILGCVHAFAHAHVCTRCTCSHAHTYLHTLTCTHLACTLLLCTRLHCTCFFARAFSSSPFAFSCYAFSSRVFASRCAFLLVSSLLVPSLLAVPSISSTGSGAAAAASLSTRSERRRAAWFRDHVAGSMRVTLRVTTLCLRAGSSWGGTNPPSPPPTSPRVPLRLLSLQARPVGGAIAS